MTTTAPESSTIQNYEIEYVNINELKFDPDNPNVLNAKQMHGLTESFKKFGYLSPIIIDQNNLIADGEHRAAIYKQFNIQQIPAYRLTFKDDVERRILRQTMNKLRGQHDYELDLKELEFIHEKDSEALQNILALGDKELEMMRQFVTNEAVNISSIHNEIENEQNQIGYGYQGLATQMPLEQQEGERRIDPDTIAHHANTFLYGSIKQIVLYFRNEDYEQVIQKMQEIMRTENIKNHTDLFTFLLKYYEISNANNATPATTTD